MDWVSGPVFLGFRVKRPWELPSEMICCVGDNLCEPPDGWIDRWDFNRASCYGSPELAWSTVPGNPSPYRLFAYFLFPIDLYEGEPPAAVSLGEIFSDLLPDLPRALTDISDFVQLGYDVAEHNFGFLGYAYSPLLTNGFAKDFPTNRFGLLDSLETAFRACEAINVRMPEHAPHWVFQVLGKDIDKPLPSDSCREEK